MGHLGKSLIVAIAVVATACGSSSGTDVASQSHLVPPPPFVPGTSVEVTPIQVHPETGSSLTNQSGYDLGRHLVITGPAGWADEWARIWARHDPVPPLPAVDFSREFVVVAASGVHASGGFQVLLNSAFIADGVLSIPVIEVVPGTGCAVAAVNTSPVSAVRMPNFYGPIEFVEWKSTRVCPP